MVRAGIWQIFLVQLKLLHSWQDTVWLKYVPYCRCWLWQWLFKTALSITCGSRQSTTLSPLFCRTACRTADVPCHRQFWINCPFKATAAALALRRHLNLQRLLHLAESQSSVSFMQPAAFRLGQLPELATKWHQATPLPFTSAVPCCPKVHASSSQVITYGATTLGHCIKHLS